MVSHRVAAEGYVYGRVQGVGFRAFLAKWAKEFNVAGWTRNCPDGRVSFRVEGGEFDVERWLAECRKGPLWSRVDRVDVKAVEAEMAGDQPLRFEIRG